MGCRPTTTTIRQPRPADVQPLHVKSDFWLPSLVFFSSSSERRQEITCSSLAVGSCMQLDVSAFGMDPRTLPYGPLDTTLGHRTLPYGPSNTGIHNKQARATGYYFTACLFRVAVVFRFDALLYPPPARTVPRHGWCVSETFL